VRCEWLEKESVPGKKKERVPQIGRKENFCFVVQLELLFVFVLYFVII